MFFFTYSYSFLLDMNSYWDLMQEFAGYDNPRVDWDFLTKAKLYFMALTMSPFLMFGAVPAYITHRVKLWHAPVHEHTWWQRHNPFHIVLDKVEDLQTWYEDRKGATSCSYCPLFEAYALSSPSPGLEVQLTPLLPPSNATRQTNTQYPFYRQLSDSRGRGVHPLLCSPLLPHCARV